MRQGLRLLTGLIPVIAVAGCGSPGYNATASQTAASSQTVAPSQHTFRDTTGWAVKVPPGWYEVPFSDSSGDVTAAGVQLSNVKLSPPVLRPGLPIQTSAVLPASGVGVVIATDTDAKVPHGPMAAPPLPAFHGPNGWKYWNAGSAVAGNPVIEILWFHDHGKTFVATVKIGPKATSGDRKAAGTVIQSLH